MWSVSSLLPPLKCVGIIFWFPLSAWKSLSCALHWGIRTVLELCRGQWDINGMEAAERHWCRLCCAVMEMGCTFPCAFQPSFSIPWLCAEKEQTFDWKNTQNSSSPLLPIVLSPQGFPSLLTSASCVLCLQAPRRWIRLCSVTSHCLFPFRCDHCCWKLICHKFLGFPSKDREQKLGGSLQWCWTWTASEKSGHRHMFCFYSLTFYLKKNSTPLHSIFNKSFVNACTLRWILRNLNCCVFFVASCEVSSEDVFRTLNLRFHEKLRPILT